jgi:integrase
MIEIDPSYGIKRVHNPSNGWHEWTEAQVAQYETYYPTGTKARLAMDALLYLTQRSGDIRQFGPEHVHAVKPFKIGRYTITYEARFRQELRTSKTKVELVLPILPPLAASLAAFPTEAGPFIKTRFGDGYTAQGFSQWIGRCCAKAGLPREAGLSCSAHGLRKVALRRIADNGGTDIELKAQGGHRTSKQLAVYIQGADQRRNARKAGAKLLRV